MTSADLLAALASADASPAHWADLVERHGSRLWAVCRAAAGAGLADDAFQEGLIAIRHGAGRFRPGADPEASAVAWMVTVVHRRAIDLVRRESRRSTHESSAMPSNLADPTPATVEEDAASAHLAMRALEQLPERHQRVIRLRLLGGLDAAQTASVLGCPAEHVRVRLQRALDLLRSRCVQSGAVLPSVVELQRCIEHAASPATTLPASAKAIALISFTKPAGVTAGLSFGAIMAISSIGCALLATLILVVPMHSVPASEQPTSTVAAAATAAAVSPPRPDAIGTQARQAVAQETNTWVNISPPDFAPGEFGTQSIVADPARPGDFYFCGNQGQGLWKTTDFGTTWVHSELKSDYAMAIDPNPKRDPGTPPTLWANSPWAGGALRSTDGGKTWTIHKIIDPKANDQQAGDAYDFDLDPTDSKHLIIGLHGVPGMYESHDGGDTWTRIPAADGKLGVSLYVFFTDPSPAEMKTGASISTTWLTMSQAGSGGVFRTIDGGSTFTQVEQLQHEHGNAQMFMAGNGVVYMAGCYGSQGHGVYRSADFGVTWMRVNDGATENGVYGTPQFIYADDGAATAGVHPANLQRAPRATGTQGTWTHYVPIPPMSNGSGHAAIAFDGTHYVILTADWKAGIWRYVEP